MTSSTINTLNYFNSFSLCSGFVVAKSFGAACSFEDSGKICLPVIKTFGSELQILGHIVFSYLLISPFTHSMLDDKEIQESGRIFRKNKKNLSIGHRGSGANAAESFEGTFPLLLENTLLSFCNAANLGSDFIEFDINLSGDGVPVIFHDFSIPMIVQPHTLNKKVKIPINSLFLEEFKLISTANQMDHHSKGIEHDSYPTLKELFDSFPSGVGFDIELKYPGFEESIYCIPRFSRNEMVDKVLQVSCAFI